MPFPINFKPKHSYKLIRLGNDCDGGYLVDEESVLKSKFLIGMGISTDWSFEKDFRKHQPVLTHCYDHTLTIGFFIMHTIKSFLMIFQGRLKNFFLCLKFLIDYQLFFQGSVRHLREKIGCDNERAISINNVLSRASTIDQESVFIKMDIEGSEYRILDELIYNANSLSGLVIEFEARSLTEIDYLTLETAEGQIYNLNVGKNLGKFTPSHIRQHMVHGELVEISYFRRDGENWLGSIQDFSLR